MCPNPNLSMYENSDVQYDNVYINSINRIPDFTRLFSNFNQYVGSLLEENLNSGDCTKTMVKVKKINKNNVLLESNPLILS